MIDDDECCVVYSGVGLLIVPIEVLMDASKKLAAGCSFLINRDWLIEQGSDVIAPSLNCLAMTVSVHHASSLHNQESWNVISCWNDFGNVLISEATARSRLHVCLKLHPE